MLLNQLELTNYRNFVSEKFEFEKGVSLIIGPNGIGKTNILESISILAPGRGLRSSKPEEIVRHEENAWNISALCEGNLGAARLDVSYSSISAKKQVNFNDSKISSNELTNFINVIWLTPQMDGIFLGSPSERRKFLDRMTFSKHTNHASLVSKYEKLQRERMQILEKSGSNSWLEIIEKEMADLAIGITENRLGTINNVNKDISNIDPIFPKAKLELEGKIVEFFDKENRLDLILEEFKANREKDKYSGRNHFGVQKSDMQTFYDKKNIPAHNCSTGEQKALLTSIILAHQLASNNRPLLLLDEIFVHLDENRRKALGEFLLFNGAQTFITSTDIETKNYLDSAVTIML